MNAAKAGMKEELLQVGAGRLSLAPGRIE